MILEALAQKYDPLKNRADPVCETATEPAETATPPAAAPASRPLASWHDSPAVVALSQFLKEYKDQGIILVRKKDAFTLKFEPGLRSDDHIDRWAAAVAAFNLLCDAIPDLVELTDRGLLRFDPS
jgi:hypothetical protein